MPSIVRVLAVAPLLFAPVLLAQPAPVVVTGAPVAPSPPGDGAGLCLTARSSTNPFTDFPQSADSFASGLNAFLEASPEARVTYPLRTPLDLSNAHTTGTANSDGDFSDAVPGCPPSGCGLPFDDATTSFGMRLRGFLRVTEDLVGQPVHFGLYADDAVALTLYDAQGAAYPVVVRPPALGLPAWRVTNAVTFSAAGLYPVEVLYAQVTERAALELSLFAGDFTDFERPASQAPVTPLDESGFTLLPPASFFRTTNGTPAGDDDACRQCERQSAGLAGHGGCPVSQHCNLAAVCEPCDEDAFCGESCAPCGGDTPRCAPVGEGFGCVACLDDADCGAGAACEQDGCVEIDAGTPDAGLVDAGAQDAGIVDAGIVDAGEADAGGSADAGETDAGETDAGETDAGETDAGAPDAGETDAGAPSTDGGETDAGPGTPDPTGCGCRQAGAGPSLGLGLLAALALLRRRHRRA